MCKIPKRSETHQAGPRVIRDEEVIWVVRSFYSINQLTLFDFENFSDENISLLSRRTDTHLRSIASLQCRLQSVYTEQAFIEQAFIEIASNDQKQQQKKFGHSLIKSTTTTKSLTIVSFESNSLTHKTHQNMSTVVDYTHIEK